jgi:hypothetical protein
MFRWCRFMVFLSPKPTFALNYLVSGCGALGLSLRILVRAAAASSRAHETLDVRRLNTSGSASAFPSVEESLLMPGKTATVISYQNRGLTDTLF